MCMYYMEGGPLSDVEHHPYLGVELDSSLSWDLHLANTRSKSTFVLNMIRRNSTIGTNMNIRQALYFSLVCPHLEYASTVWDPQHKTKIDKLEKVQNQAARFVTKRYDRMDSLSEMKRQLEWNSLQERRFVQCQSVIYKVHNQLTHYSLPGLGPITQNYFNYNYFEIESSITITITPPYCYTQLQLHHVHFNYNYC